MQPAERSLVMSRFEGIITPIITPFFDDDRQAVNEKALEDHINYLIDHGVSGLFVLGSNGEFHVLDHDEKLALVDRTVRIVNGRVPVYAGCGACSTREAIELASGMEKLGVDALSVINPWFLQPSDEDLYQHYKAIAESVHIPIILYNIPKATGRSLSPELVERLAEIDNIQAIKDSSGSLELLEAYARIAKDHDFELLVGSDSKISAAYALGAVGAVAGTSNLIPDILVGLDQALRKGDFEKAAVLQQAIEPLRAVLPLGTVPSVLKKAIELKGICAAGPARKPVGKLNEAAVAKVKEMVNHYEKSPGHA